MAKKPSALASVFDDEVEEPVQTTAAVPTPEPRQGATARRSRRPAETPESAAAAAAPIRRNSHPGKKPVLIHIPEEMHRTLRQLSVEEGGEPLTVITERLLRQYLVSRGHTRFAP